jgi:hypothetical protein
MLKQVAHTVITYFRLTTICTVTLIVNGTRRLASMALLDFPLLELSQLIVYRRNLSII